MRVVGVDLGARRIGVAVSDSARRMASAHSTLERSGDERTDHAALGAIVAEVGATHVVVGLPLTLAGRRSDAARRAEAEAGALASALAPVTVELFDERLTTAAAGRQLRAAGRDARRARAVVDGVAAAVMLQDWLDRGRAT